jgi:hypothetical protein
MRHHLCTLALALVATTGVASAQTSTSTQGQSTAQQQLNLDNAQRHQVTQGLSNQQAQAQPPGFDGQLGGSDQ